MKLDDMILTASYVCRCWLGDKLVYRFSLLASPSADSHNSGAKPAFASSSSRAS